MHRMIAVSEVINQHIKEVAGRNGFAYHDAIIDEFLHSYGVAYFAAVLARKQGLDPVLACIAGLLHDAGRIIGNVLDKTHGATGAVIAENILNKTGLFSPEEIELISAAVRFHSHKKIVGAPYEEIIKDADLLERFFGMDDGCTNAPRKRKRLKRAIQGMGFKMKKR